MLPTAIRKLMKDRIVVHLVAGRDAYDDITDAAEIVVMGRVTYEQKLISGTGGNQITTVMSVRMPDVPGFTVDASLTLPDGKRWQVKSFNRPAWPNGTRHLRVYL